MTGVFDSVSAALDYGEPKLGIEPEPMRPEAYVGPLGETVKMIGPFIETCPEALLIELLVFFGNAAGRTSHFQVGRTKHYANLFVVLVGRSSRARKGTVRNIAADVITMAEPTWAASGIIGGATSGEGMVAAVRDPTVRRVEAKEGQEADEEGFTTEVVDGGVGDKRKVFDEEELSAVFKIAAREGNTVSERLRTLYDKGEAQIVNKNSPMRATNAHVSVNGHITIDELRARLSDLDAANGFGNRFLYCHTRRVRKLPFAKNHDDELRPHARALRDALAFAREHEAEVTWAPEARQAWSEFYEAVPDDALGIVGALTARAEAHVMRLALLYAIADKALTVGVQHLRAAIAVWDYCEASVRWAWGNMVGDASADKILAALRQIGPRGLAKTEIRTRCFGNSKPTAEINTALDLLTTTGLIVSEGDASTGGRAGTRFWAAEHAPTRQGAGKDGK